MEPRARIGCNLDTCKHGRPPIIKLMSNEHREDEVGGAGKANIPTHTRSVTGHTWDG